LGTLWDTFTGMTEAIGDAAEVRCAYLLKLGETDRAKTTTHKTLFVGSSLAVFVSFFVFVGGTFIPQWLTNDATLQDIIWGVIPFLALGNIALSFGQLCRAVFGSKGRYWLGTAVTFFATCFLCMPIAALFTFALDFDLSGQTAAIVVGYLAAESINAYILFTTDWGMLSDTIPTSTTSSSLANYG
jgi:Na+-driven multidrug efflux pump